MRHGTGSRRSRNRGNGNNRRTQSRNQVFDSNGPDVRIRGTANQIHEKYIALAKDAAASGDRVMSESYLQHAEYYQRVFNGWNDMIEDYEFDPRALERYLNASRPQEQQDGNNPPPQRQYRETPAEEDLGLPESITGAPVQKVRELEGA